MGALVLALLAPAAVGYVAVIALWPAGQRGDRALLLKACLAFGLGMGFASWSYFLWLVVAGAPGFGLVVAEAAALALLLGGFVWMIRRSRATPELPTQPADALPYARTIGVILTIVFGAVFLVRMAHIIGLNALKPHSDGDAVFIWNMKARFLYRAGDDWRLIFSFANPDNTKLPLAPADYPLLVPASVARAWWYRGAESTFEPALIALLFTAGSLVLLYAAVAAVRGRSQGAVAGLALAATPWFIYLGAAQVADIPLSFYMLAAVALFALHDADGGSDRRRVVLAGLMAGLAGWTKNEGCLFIAVLFAVRLLLVAVRSGSRAAARESAALLLGLLPFGCLLVYFRLGLVPSTNYLLADQGGPTALDRLTNPGRYVAVLVYTAIQLFLPLHRFHFSSIGFIVWFAPLYRLWLGRAPAAARRAAATPGLVAALMLLGYLFVYLTTPLDLNGHLTSSMHRILMHLWPLVLLWFALSTATPEEALARKEDACPAAPR